MSVLPYFGPCEIHNGGPGIYDPTWSWSNPGQGDWAGLTLSVVDQGRGVVIDEDGAVHEVARGDALVMRWDRARVQRHVGSDPLVMPWCSFDWSDDDDRQCWAAEAPAFMLRHISAPDLILGCLRRVADETTLGHQAGAVIYLRAALAEYAAAPRYGKNIIDEWGHRIRSVCRAMQEHPEQTWSASDLAAAHHCDPDHFARIFRRETGIAPGQYAIRCRIDRARHLLLHYAEWSIGAIAEELGYSTPFFFSKQFKQYTGKSPRAYRQAPPS